MFDKTVLAAKQVQLEGRQPLHFQAGRRPIDQLVNMAATARARGFQIVFCGLEARAMSDLVKIAGAGGRWAGRSDRPPNSSRI